MSFAKRFCYTAQFFVKLASDGYIEHVTAIVD